MKVTANLPDRLIEELRDLNPDKNLTEALQSAVEAWIRQRRVASVLSEVREKHLEFVMDAQAIRETNRS